MLRSKAAFCRTACPAFVGTRRKSGFAAARLSSESRGKGLPLPAAFRGYAEQVGGAREHEAAFAFLFRKACQPFPHEIAQGVQFSGQLVPTPFHPKALGKGLDGRDDFRGVIGVHGQDFDAAGPHLLRQCAEAAVQKDEVGLHAEDAFEAGLVGRADIGQGLDGRGEAVPRGAGGQPVFQPEGADHLHGGSAEGDEPQLAACFGRGRGQPGQGKEKGEQSGPEKAGKAVHHSTPGFQKVKRTPATAWMPGISQP